MAMNIEDIVLDHPELQTPEEKEESDFNSFEAAFKSPPDWYRQLSMDLGVPDEFGRRDFEARKPGLGLSMKQIDELDAHSKDQRLLPVQQRLFFDRLKHDMLRRLISTDGATSTQELLDILRNEVQSGTPAPVPKWYVFSKVTHGPRRRGYYACTFHDCHHTETIEKAFAQCSRCKLAFYCSRDCQVADWKGRHKKLCKEAAEMREKTAKAGAFIQMFQQQMS